MKEYGLFPSTLWSDDLNLNVDELRREIDKFSKVNPSVNYSNAGGYQGHGFYYKPLIDSIQNAVPRYDDPELGDLFIGHSMWVNINCRGAHNRRHTHADGIILLSGVYYVKVPKDSGNIIFFDPRPSIVGSFADSRYFGKGASNVYPIQPKENMLLLFPCWLEHEVEPNNTNEDRISISFNIVRKKDLENYESIRSFY
tara:strand:- start:51 stop:644 length:594 start_codon:yes stop_codon:yes gene_type:complete